MSKFGWQGVGCSLKVKLSLLITGVLMLAIVLVAVVLLRQQQESLRDEMTKRGQAIAQNLASGAKTSLLQNDDLALNVLVRDAMKDDDVVYVIITDERKKVRAHSEVGQTGAALQRIAPLAFAAEPRTVGASPQAARRETEVSQGSRVSRPTLSALGHTAHGNEPSASLRSVTWRRMLSLDGFTAVEWG